MLVTAILTALMSVVALILGFLTLFAGHQPGFLEDYALLTMNSSRIGYNFFNTSQSSTNPFIQFLDNITNSIEGDIEAGFNSLAREVGVHDFYSIHVLDYCEGYYVPGPVANATLKASSIHKNVTSCNSTSQVLGFEPTTVLQRELNKTGLDIINLSELHWPAQLDQSFSDLRKATDSMVGFYGAFIGLTGLALIFALVSIVVHARFMTIINVIVFMLAGNLGTVSSSLITYYAEQGAKLINENVSDLDVVAYSGKGIQGLTWAATGLMILASLMWSVDCCLERRRHKRQTKKEYNDMAERLRVAEMNQAR